MSINGIGAAGCQTAITGYGVGKTKKAAENNFSNQTHNVQKSQMPGGAFVLHYFDNEEGERAVSASCGTDYSVTVYEPKDFDSANPVYKVKAWDKDGNITERMVDISKVNPEDCDYIDMYAYSCYAESKGCSSALSSFMGADADQYVSAGRTYSDLFTAKDWVKAVRDMMQMQYDANNLAGYLDYKKFYDYMRSGK